MNRKQIENDIYQDLREIMLTAQKNIVNNFETNGLTSAQFALLRLLEDRDGAGIKEVAQIFNVSSAAVTNVVDILVNKGLATREEKLKDRREKIIKITGKGIEQVEEFSTRITGAFFDCFNDRELLEFNCLMQKFKDNILEKCRSRESRE